MEVKTFELRDHCTFIGVICIHGHAIEEPDVQARYVLCRCGWFDSEFTYMLEINSDTIHFDPNRWNDALCKTTAHRYIIENWHNLKDGQVIDAAYIRGERPQPVESDRFYKPEENK